ncbi:hypothetical protein [Hyalangium minutum]|nr:hypothetical protein [Hyalangium minutum]
MNNPSQQAAGKFTGIFYAQGVKANVLFFERKPANKREHLDDFVACYKPGERQARRATCPLPTPSPRHNASCRSYQILQVGCGFQRISRARKSNARRAVQGPGIFSLLDRDRSFPQNARHFWLPERNHS